MYKGEKYDFMVRYSENDPLGFFENYEDNLRIVREIIEKANPKHVYDIGCGTGNLIGPLSDSIPVTGIDRSSEMLEQAMSKYPKMKMVCDDLLHWTHESVLSEGDLIVSSFVLHAFEDKKPLLAWFSKVISNGSSIVIMDYVFKDDASKSAYIDHLVDEGKQDLADIIDSKHYMTVEAFRTWADDQRFSLTFKMLTHWIGVFEVKK